MGRQSTIDGLVRASNLMGREAYEASVRAVPTYHDGRPRKKWEELDPVTQGSWARPSRHTPPVHPEAPFKLGTDP